MNAAEQKATLASKLASLRDEVVAWRRIVAEPEDGDERHADFPHFSRHQSQVLRLAELFSGLLESLAEEAERLPAGGDFPAARALSDKILQGHALWSYYRGKLLFRYSPHLRPYLLAADELAWSCLKPLLEARAAAAQGALSKVPPLIYLGRSVSPFVFPREWSLESQIADVSDEIFASLVESAPFSVVSLPFYQTRHLPETLVLAHEMGHVADFDLGLRPALDAALENIPQASVSAAHKEFWRRCRVEAFADAFGALTCRLAFCRALASFLADEKSRITSERIDLGKRAEHLYPTAYLRVLLALEVLRQADGHLPAAAAELEQEWRKGYGLAHEHWDFEPDLRHLVAAFLDTELAELRPEKPGPGPAKPATLRALVGLPAGADGDAAKIATSMVKDGFAPPTRDPRVLMAAAAFAFYQDPQAYTEREVEDMVLSRIAEDAGNPARATESIAPGIPEKDRQAGAKLAGLLGRPAAP